MWHLCLNGHSLTKMLTEPQGNIQVNLKNKYYPVIEFGYAGAGCVQDQTALNSAPADFSEKQRRLKYAETQTQFHSEKQ